MKKRIVWLKINLEVHSPYKTMRYDAGERTLPADLAALCLRNGWALRISHAPVAKVPNN